MRFCNIMQTSRELFVNPLLWTSHHLNLLGCQFEDVDSTGTGSAQDECKAAADNAITRATRPSDAELLARRPFATVKRLCLIDILVGKGGPFAKYYKGPEFFFSRVPVHRPQYTVFYRHGQPSEHVNVDRHGPPLVGYLHHGHVNGDRVKITAYCSNKRAITFFCVSASILPAERT
ncbi:uncharacterized protein BDV14DRAFT_167052 [Aspergillus stella-maris]|uniref:uncharacterized protein n=1 Tax=Aspergillus stella-maris TaxID=1810926 RepID=UPI003CCCBDDC